MNLLIQRVPRRALVDDVMHQIKALIAREQLEPGTRLPTETELMARLGVGRSTLREAVRVLAHDGVLAVRQGSGTYVGGGDANDPLNRRLRRATLLDIYEVRGMLERETARLSAERRRTEDLRQMRRHLADRNQAREQNDAAAFLEADVAFHTAVVVSSRNSVLIDLYGSFTHALREAIASLFSDPDLTLDRDDLHEELVDAIERRDAAVAEQCVVAYLQPTTERLRVLLQS